MNDFHSDSELKYKRRFIARKVREALDSFPIVVITGARQVGKSTLILNEFSEFRYITLDDFSILKQVKVSPESVLVGSNLIAIDEVQREPSILLEVKRQVDESRGRKKFILSGSSNLLLQKNISESLAGRAVYFELTPFTISEVLEREDGFRNFLKLWEGDFDFIGGGYYAGFLELLFRGLFPPLYSIDRKNISLWWDGYVRTYLERDVRDLSQVGSLFDFRKVMDSIALRTGQVVNQTEISRETGVSQPTVGRYLNILEVSYAISRLPAYSVSKGKRLVKSPKVYWVDPGLGVYLAGYYDLNSLDSSKEKGCFFENFIFNHLKVWCKMMSPEPRIYYWRTTSGAEVDFVIEWGKKLLAIEVKSSPYVSIDDAKNLINFLEEYDQAIRGVVIYTGNEIKYLHSRVVAIPFGFIC